MFFLENVLLPEGERLATDFSFVAELDCFFSSCWNDYVLFGRFLVERRPPPPKQKYGATAFSHISSPAWMLLAGLLMLISTPFHTNRHSRHWRSSSSKGDCCCICLCVSRSRGVEAFFLNKICMHGIMAVVFFWRSVVVEEKIMISDFELTVFDVLRLWCVWEDWKIPSVELRVAIESTHLLQTKIIYLTLFMGLVRSITFSELPKLGFV